MSASAPIADVQAPPASNNQTMDGLLADLARQKPGLAWLQQMLAMQRQAAAAQATGTPDVQAEAQAEIAALRDALAQAEVRMERLAAANRRLAAELEAARERIADAAATVGACGLCWGEDPRCRSCRGRGKPGLFVRQVGASSPDGEGAAAAF